MKLNLNTLILSGDAVIITLPQAVTVMTTLVSDAEFDKMADDVQEALISQIPCTLHDKILAKVLSADIKRHPKLGNMTLNDYIERLDDNNN